MKWSLAPLAGFTDAPFRLLATEGGADLVYTEMVSAAALAHGSSPTLHLMETMRGEGPVACQLFGAKEDEMAVAAKRVAAFRSEVPFCELNLNAGCPMTKVTKCGAGAELVKDPEKIYRLVKAIVENTDLPVTLKTRLGPHPQATTVFEIADAAEKAGAKGLIVHARYTSQMHGGPVHLDVLEEVVRRCRLPVTGNGSVTDVARAVEMAKTGVAGIMVGRAAVANPLIFRNFKRAFGTERVQEADDPAEREALPARHLRYLLQFRDRLAAKYPLDHVPSPDAFASVKMHVHLFRYFNGRPGAAALRARLNSVRTLAEIEEILRRGRTDAFRFSDVK